MRRILLTTAALLAISVPAFADEAPAVCDTPQKIAEGLIKSSADRGFTVVLYDEVTDQAQVAQFVQAFNETPPASNIVADMVLVFEATHTTSGTKQPGRLAIYFFKGCQVPKAGMMLPATTVDKILGPQA